MSRRASPFTWNRPHLVAFSGFVTGAAVSIAANIADARPGTGSRAFGAFWPLALLLALEVITRESWAPGRLRAWARYAGTGTVALVAAMISYGHLSNLLARYGENALYAHLGPFAIDGLMVVCATAMLPAAARPSAAVVKPTPAPVRSNKPVAAPTAAPTPSRPKPRRKQLDLGRVADLLEPTRQLLAEYESRGENLSGTKLQVELKKLGFGCSRGRRDTIRAYLYSMQADRNWRENTEYMEYLDKRPSPSLNGSRVGV